MKNLILIYSTFPDRDSSKNLVGILIKEKAVACVNLIDGMESCYEWEGKVVSSQEVIMIAKTTEEKFSQAKEIIVKNHSYDNPCVLSIPIKDGSKPFLNWVEDMVQ